MPRLKAIVSGAVGGFLDVAFNFNTQALLDDNIIVQFLKVGWKIVMHGDDMWLKLFPVMFLRHDGVSSFFVKDTVQVDQNVSRRVIDELSRTDWSLLILHYLGLDHVGHLGGVAMLLCIEFLNKMDDNTFVTLSWGVYYKVLMAPNLGEMDEVIKTIDYLPTIMIKDGHSWFVLLSFLQELCSLLNKLAVICDIPDLKHFSVIDMK